MRMSLIFIARRRAGVEGGYIEGGPAIDRAGVLLRAMLLPTFCSIRPERPLMERPQFDLLFRRFAGVGVDEPVRDHPSFSTNRDRFGRISPLDRKKSSRG